MSPRSLLFSVHSDFLTDKTQSWAVVGGKELTLCFRFVFAQVVFSFMVQQPSSLERILSLAYTQHCPCHSQYQFLARDLGMRRCVSAFSWWLQEACERRQMWVHGMILCGCCLSALLVTLPNQMVLKDVTDVMTKYCPIIPNSIVLACAEFSLKPIFVGNINWIFHRIWEMLFLAQ